MVITKKDKISQLEKELKRLEVIAPFVSEGTISAVQIGRFSKRQKIQWEKDKSRRFDVIAEIKILKMPKLEKRILNFKKELKKLENRFLQNESQIRTLKDFPQIKSKRMNQLKKQFILAKEENKEFAKKIRVLKRIIKTRKKY